MGARCWWYIGMVWMIVAAAAAGEERFLLSPAPELGSESEVEFEIPDYFYEWEGSLRRLSGVELAREVASLVEKFKLHTDPQTEYNPWLLPIRVLAGRSVAYAEPAGDLSLKTQQGLRSLKSKIAKARGLLNTLMKREATFELSVQLLTVEEELLDRLGK